MPGLVRVPNQSCRRQSLGTFEVRVVEAPALLLATKVPITALSKFMLLLFIGSEPESGEFPPTRVRFLPINLTH